MTPEAAGSRGPLRVAVVGTGIGRLHAEAMARMPGTARLVALCSRHPEEARALALACGAAKATQRFEELLADPEVEALDLCVPPKLHLPMALAAAAAGKHILVEKPIARSLDEADAMIAAAEKAGVTLMVGHNQRFMGQNAKARSLVAEGAIGLPFMAMASVHVHGQIEGFRRFLEEAGGGTLIDSGVHRFDLLRWTLGEVESVCAFTGRLMQEQMEGEDCAVVNLRFQSGALGSFTCTWSAKLPRRTETMLYLGPGGSIATDDGARSLMLHREAPQAGPGVSREFSFKEDQAESIRLAIEAFAASVRRGVEPPVTGADGRAALALALACYRSAASGLPERMEG